MLIVCVPIKNDYVFILGKIACLKNPPERRQGGEEHGPET